MEKFRLEDLSWIEVNQAFKNGINTIVIMVGAIEQHGPHLPLSTDSLIAEKIGLEIVRKLGNALLAPIIKVGASEYHLDFPGTISIKEEVLIEVIIDYCRCLIKHGFNNIVVLPTHSGNCKAIDGAIQRLRQGNKKVKLLGFSNLMGYFEPIFKTASELGISSFIAGPHAGEAETSMILSINPDLVEMDRAKIGYMGDPVSARPLIVEKGTKFVSERGVFGDPTHATQTHGTAYLSSVVNYFVTYIQHGLENSNP